MYSKRAETSGLHTSDARSSERCSASCTCLLNTNESALPPTSRALSCTIRTAQTIQMWLTATDARSLLCTRSPGPSQMMVSDGGVAFLMTISPDPFAMAAAWGLRKEEQR